MKKICSFLSIICFSLYTNGSTSEDIKYTIEDVKILPLKLLVIDVEINQKGFKIFVENKIYEDMNEFFAYLATKKIDKGLLVNYHSKFSCSTWNLFIKRIVNFSFQNKLDLYIYYCVSKQAPKVYAHYIFM